MGLLGLAPVDIVLALVHDPSPILSDTVLGLHHYDDRIWHGNGKTHHGYKRDRFYTEVLDMILHGDIAYFDISKYHSWW